VTTAQDRLYAVVESLKSAGVTTETQKLTYLPETSVPITDETVATQVLRLCEALEENDDVQNVHANFELPEELLTRIST
jgi:transcriptional/translational regulatory protein YebC/TACO1